MQLLQEFLIKLRSRDQVLDHQANAVHLLALLHVELDLQLRLQRLDRHLQLLHLDQVSVYFHVVLLHIDLHLSHNVLQLPDVVPSLSYLLLVDEGFAQLKLDRGKALVLLGGHGG